MAFVLKIVTLNCWGIAVPYVSQDRAKRIAAIAEELSRGEYDIVALEEIWSEADYEYIRKAVSNVLPFAFYFHSGFIGSGVCVFSKARIVNTLMHRYSLNGYAHHIHRGDWFGGKVVGLAQIMFQGLRINVYATHIHAEYERTNDHYLPHRVVQSFELSQFVRQTSSDADIVVAVGDFNLEPNDAGYRLIMLNTGLRDAWIDRQNTCDSKDDGNTCDTPSNSYTRVDQLLQTPEGKRIDYIMYGSYTGWSLSVKECCRRFGRIPDSDISYSDHEGVYAQIVANRQSGPPARSGSVSYDENQFAERLTLLEHSVKIITDSLDRMPTERRVIIGILVALALLFFYSVNLELSGVMAAPVMFCRFLLTLLIGYIILYGLILLQLEEKALKAAKMGISVLIQREASRSTGGGDTEVQ